LIHKKSVLVIRTLWFTISVISLIWFLYWICYEVFVWNKFLSQATPVNYVALAISIVALIISTQLGRIRYFSNPKLLVEPNFPKRELEKNQTQQVQHLNYRKKQMIQDSEAPLGCRFYLGYLSNRPKSVEVPQDCMGCNQMLNCLNKENAT
jgi:hypothetical protein